MGMSNRERTPRECVLLESLSISGERQAVVVW